VLFVDDGRRDLTDLRRRRPTMFANLDRSAIRRIAAMPGPVHVVTTSRERGSQGDPIFVGINGDRILNVPFASRVVLPIRRDITASVVLIDRSAIVGLTSRQIADYAAMRSLAMLNPDGALSGTSILTLFAPANAPVPEGMTPFDRGYLKALYTGSGDQRAIAKIDQIARGIASEGHPKR
jgi:hypothetical protein